MFSRIKQSLLQISVPSSLSFHLSKMAAASYHVDAPQLHYQCYNVDQFSDCANCSHLEYKLRATNEELISAKTIIALLRKDLIDLNTWATGQQLTYDPQGPRNNMGEYNSAAESWSTINRHKGKYQNKGDQIDVMQTTNNTYSTYNCFQPLANLKEM
jgi:hypothetical protein